MVAKSKNSPEQSGEKQKKDTKFKKGVSGNPNGRPAGTYSLLTILKRELEKTPEGQDKKSYGELIVRRMLKEAIEKGDVQQIKLIWNYIEGMPRESHDISVTLPIPLDDLSKNNSLSENKEDTEKNQSDPRRNERQQDSLDNDLPDSPSTK